MLEVASDPRSLTAKRGTAKLERVSDGVQSEVESQIGQHLRFHDGVAHTQSTKRTQLRNSIEQGSVSEKTLDHEIQPVRAVARHCRNHFRTARRSGQNTDHSLN